MNLIQSKLILPILFPRSAYALIDGANAGNGFRSAGDEWKKVEREKSAAVASLVNPLLDLPVAAVPCLQPGAIPLQILNATEWMENACLKGFYVRHRLISFLLVG